MTSGLRALLVDYGGVLTSPPVESFRQWLELDGLDLTDFRDLMRRWFAADAPANIVHDLETGRLAPAEFERQLAEHLVRADGTTVDAAGLLTRMFAGFEVAPSMVGVVRQVHTAGVRTALVSNSWGFDYHRDGWDALFDAVVISGEVGLRKPDPDIYLLAARRLGLPADACVFVDDMPANVRGAVAVGMVGVHHTSLESTVEELEILFGLTLR